MKKYFASALVIFAIAFFAACSVEANAEPTITVVTPTEPTAPASEPTIPPTEAPTEPEPTIPETEPLIFGEDITFTYEYIAEDDVMPYGLFTPSTVDENVKIPLIVWLHGSGERDVSEATFARAGLPGTLNNWTLEGFNAYVICPQLKGTWNPGAWCFPQSKDMLQAVLDKFISEHNIDTDKIIICGHSLGAQGALYMAHEMADYFSKLAVFSGYWTDVDITEITMPTIGYVGMTSCGEDGASSMYMAGHFSPAFGEENTIWLPTDHGNLPNMAFNLDKDTNGRSDVIEWMLQY